MNLVKKFFFWLTSLWKPTSRDFKLTIGSWNACGLKKIQKLHHFLIQNSIVILVLSEIPLNGFQVERRCRPDDRGYDGVAIIIKEGIPHKLLPETNCPVENIAIQIQGNLWLVGIYCTANNFTLSSLNSLITGNKTILVEDFNTRHENWNCLSRNRNGNILNNYLDININHILYFTDKPTHFPTNNTSFTTDLVISKNGPL